MKQSILLLLACLSLFPASAKVSLPALFCDHMVLQQQAEVSIWGWATPREKITVIGSWDGKAVETVADSYANWQLKLQTPAAGGPHHLTIIGSNTLVIEDVLIGEVWICSGQSNMEWSAVNGFDDSQAEVFAAQHPNIRLFQVENRSSPAPQLDVAGQWEVCSPKTMQSFSAVGYFFGRALLENLHVPIGLINSSWGGTPVESWMNPQLIEENPAFATAAEKIKPMPWCPEYPGATYHSMLQPLIPYRIAGALWYQGETNVANHETYADMFGSLIQGWREDWGHDFPFYYVQIAPYRYGSEGGVRIREAQRQTLQVPQTGMVVISDIGDTTDIHPRNKKEVGNRLANWALANTYDLPGIAYSGPLYQRMEAKGKTMIVHFSHAQGGLVSKGGAVSHLEIAGKDQLFVPAIAEIQGNTLVVSAKSVAKPVAVRFGWSNTAEPNLFNQAGLPASCFSGQVE